MWISKTTLIVLIIVTSICEIRAQIECDERQPYRTDCPGRPCSPDGSCRKQNRECKCDGTCGLSCLKKYCPLLAVSHGSITYTPTERHIGGEAAYSCDDGYAVFGSATRTCNSDKTWSGSEPICNESGVTTVMNTAVTTPEPEVECVRNQNKISRPGRTCMRPCEDDASCFRDRKCVCDDFCGKSCIPIERENYCPELLGSNAVSVEITPNRLFGSRAVLTCTGRYESTINVSSLERKCQGDGQWSGSPLVCIPKVRCGAPPVVEQASHDGNSEYYVSDDEVIYTCDHGYYRRGFRPVSTCRRRTWSDPEFECSRKSCGDPGSIINGRRLGYSFLFMDSVEYVCYEGYRLRGLARRFCQTNQQWSGSLPTCHPVVCPALQDPEHGRKIGSDYSYDEVVSFRCDSRYILDGQESLRCLANGSWSGSQPSCHVIRCPAPPLPVNGLSDARLETYQYQGVVRFNCLPTYTLVGSDRTECNEQESWSNPTPLCISTCLVPQIANGWVQGSPVNTRVRDGVVLQYQCRYGYVKCRYQPILCNTGEWEPRIDSLCLRRGCNELVVPSGTIATFSDGIQCDNFTPRGTVVTFSCERGYRLSSSSPRQSTCNIRSQWSTRSTPSCEIISCPYLNLEHGRVTYQLDGRRTYTRQQNTTAFFFCDAGYRQYRPPPATCDNGEWNQSTPVCIGDPCYEEDLESDLWSVEYTAANTTPGSRPHGSVAIFTCNEYGYSTDVVNTCNIGSWEGDQPQCNKIPCEQEELLNGQVTYRPEFHIEHGVERTFECDAGYELFGNETSVCDAGDWTNELPECIEKPCSEDVLSDNTWEVQYEPNGAVEAGIGFRQIGTVANFVCQEAGYGSEERLTCRLGSWEGDWPSCRKKRCPTENVMSPELVVSYFRSNGVQTDVPRHGDTMFALCEAGYALQGTTNVPCFDGNWDSTIPHCIEKPCSEDDLRNNNWEVRYEPGGAVDAGIGFRQIGTVANFVCQEVGYESEERLTCRLGSWEGDWPSCRKKRCPTENVMSPELVVSYFSSNDTQTNAPHHGDIMCASCEAGYTLEGTTNVTCLDGNWDSMIPHCIENPCARLSDVPEMLTVRYNLPNGDADNDTLEYYPARTFALFLCNDANQMPSETSGRKCKEGTWKKEYPECVIASCSHIDIANGYGRYTRDDSIFSSDANNGDLIKIFCNDGYTLNGPSTRLQCVDRQWSHQIPQCVKTLCSHIDIANGNGRHRDGSNFSGDANHGDLIQFSCNDGYDLQGPSTRLQCENGQWSHQEPYCNERNCSAVVLISYQSILYNGIQSSLNSFSPNTIVDVECAHGSYVKDEGRGTCLKGRWEPRVPECVLYESCQALENQDGRNILYHGYEGINPLPHDSTLTVSCDIGNALVGRANSGCCNGSWIPAVGRCHQNIALEKTARQSRTGYGGTADRAIDGDTNVDYNTGTCMHTGALQLDPWWYVDLGDVYLIKEIVIYNRELQMKRTVLGAQLRVGDNADVIKNTLIGTIHDVSENPIRVNVSQEVEGHIVSINQEGRQQTLSFCEVQVVGQYIGPSCSGCIVPYLENGFYSRSNSPNWRVENGTCYTGLYLYGHCKNGYERRGSHYSTCSSDQLTFTAGLPTCALSQLPCSKPRYFPGVTQYVGNDLLPADQFTFNEGDVINSRCSNPRTHRLIGSSQIRCQGGQWSDTPPSCELSSLQLTVGNTGLINVAPNGTIVVFTISGDVYIYCTKTIGTHVLLLHITKDNVEQITISLNQGRTQRYRINSPTHSDSGTYTCKAGQMSHTIQVNFRDIRCPIPQSRIYGAWHHSRATANSFGVHTYIYMERVDLQCYHGYYVSGALESTCDIDRQWNPPLAVCRHRSTL